MFSKGTPTEIRNTITDRLGVKEANYLGTYVGYPTKMRKKVRVA